MTGVIGTLALVVALEGYYITRLTSVHRMVFGVLGLAALVPEIKSDIIGVALFAFFTWLNLKQSRTDKIQPAEAV